MKRLALTLISILIVSFCFLSCSHMKNLAGTNSPLAPSVKTFHYTANAYTRTDFEALAGQLQYAAGAIISPTTMQYPDVLDRIQKANPDFLSLIYVGIGSMPKVSGSIWDDFWKGIQPEWEVHGINGEVMKSWGYPILNVTNDAYLQFHLSVLSRWIGQLPEAKGIFFDYITPKEVLAFFTGIKTDLNKDGKPDTTEELDTLWGQGLEKYIGMVRAQFPNLFLMANTRYMIKGLNGIFIESYPQGRSSDEIFESLKEAHTLATEPKLSVVHLDNPTQSQDVALLATVISLMFDDVATCTDFGPTNHAQAWRWPALYQRDLGKSLGEYTKVDEDPSEKMYNLDKDIGDFKVVTDGCYRHEGYGTGAIKNGVRIYNNNVGRMTTDCLKLPAAIEKDGQYQVGFHYHMRSTSPLYMKASEVSGGQEDFMIVEHVFGKATAEEGDAIFTFSGGRGKTWDLTFGIDRIGAFMLDDFTIKRTGGVYSRKYEKGAVIFNNGRSTVDVDLGGNGPFFTPFGKQIPGTIVHVEPNSFTMLLTSYEQVTENYTLSSLTHDVKKGDKNETGGKSDTEVTAKDVGCDAPAIIGNIPVTWSSSGCFRINEGILKGSGKVCAVGDHNGWVWDNCTSEDQFTPDGAGGLWISRPILCGKNWTGLQHPDKWASYQSGEGVKCTPEGSCSFHIDCNKSSPGGKWSGKQKASASESRVKRDASIQDANLGNDGFTLIRGSSTHVVEDTNKPLQLEKQKATNTSVSSSPQSSLASPGQSSSGSSGGSGILTWTADGTFSIDQSVLPKNLCTSTPCAAGDYNNWDTNCTASTAQEQSGRWVVKNPALFKKRWNLVCKTPAGVKWATFNSGSGVECGENGCYFLVK